LKDEPPALIQRLIGEASRELGVLLMLFAPLERLVVRSERLTLGFAVTVVALVFLLLGGGILIERRRPGQ